MAAVGVKPIRAQYFLNGPIREPDIAHVTILTGMSFESTGPEFKWVEHAQSGRK